MKPQHEPELRRANHWAEVSRCLLAEFYSKLATMAFERHQWELADDYIRLANRVLA